MNAILSSFFLGLHRKLNSLRSNCHLMFLPQVRKRWSQVGQKLSYQSCFAIDWSTLILFMKTNISGQTPVFKKKTPDLGKTKILFFYEKLFLFGTITTNLHCLFLSMIYKSDCSSCQLSSHFSRKTWVPQEVRDLLMEDHGSQTTVSAKQVHNT